MKRQTAGYRVAVLLLTVYAVMFALNHMTPPTLSDDILYRCVWTADEAMEQRAIETLGDIVESQTVHYQVVNGRIVVHTVAQLFIGILGKNIFDVLNALFFCLLVWCCAVFAMGADGGYGRHTDVFDVRGCGDIFMPMLIFSFLFFVLIPGFQDAFLWFVGSFNYLWTALAVLLFIIYFYRSERLSVGWHGVAVCPLALLAGWTHEGLTLPLSLGFGLWMAVERRRVLNSAAFPAVVCFMAGTALSVLSPGTMGRAGANAEPLLGKLLLGGFNFVAFVRIFWLLAVAVAVAWFRRRDVLVSELRRRYVLYFTLFMSLGIVLVCGQTEARVCFHADFIASLLLVSLLARCGVFVSCGRSGSLGARRCRAFTVAACAVMAAIALPVLHMAAVNKANYDCQLEQQKAAGVELIRVKHLPESGSALFDRLVRRYVKPSVEFGFYSCYQGFDVADVNLRCAAAVYGKSQMMYLPDDVAAQLDKKGGITELFSDRYGEISVLPVANGQRVTALDFVLKPERFCYMPFYRRLFAYKGDVYHMPDIKFKTVDFGGRTYLFYANPPGGIMDFVEETRIDF